MEAVNTENKCSRCAVTPHPFIGEDDGANSRSTMDGADPLITVCSTCRDREVFRSAAGLPAIPFERWPVPLEALIVEDRLRLAYLRSKPVTETLNARRRRESVKSSP
jgi:hypothetical protein